MMQVRAQEDCPYKGLIPYSEEDAAFFFGRKADQRIIASNLYASRLTILYGPSGVGKSSVLQAGVAHDLHQQSGQAVVVFRDWQINPLASLKQAIANELDRIAPGKRDDVQYALPLDEFLQQYQHDIRGPLVVILDQFEEYFLYHPNDGPTSSFAAEFARAVNDSDCPSSFLIAVREDALSKLDRFERRIPGLFDNYLRVEHLDKEAARQAMVGPLEVYNQRRDGEQWTIQDGLVEEVIDQVKTGQFFIGQVGRGRIASRNGTPLDDQAVRIETPYFQLVLTRLWSEEVKRGSRVLRLDTLAALGGAQEIVCTHLDTAMGALKASQQEISAHLFHYLVTPSGMKIAHTVADLSSYVDMPAPKVLDVVERLSDRDLRVLRPVSTGLDTQAETRYEIFHDVLASAVLDWRARYLSRPNISRMMSLLTMIVFISGVIIQFAPLSPSALTVIRMISLFALQPLPLLQVFKWFSRHISLTTGSFSINTSSRRNLPVLLSALLTLLWCLTTGIKNGPSGFQALGAMTPSDFIALLIFTGMATLLVGFATFIAMRASGQITRKLFKNFDLGFYSIYFISCALVIALIALRMLNILRPLFTIE